MQKLDKLLSDYLIILVILILATIIATWPLAATLGSQIPGSEGDAWEHLWTFRWVKEALDSQTDIFFTDQIFYPEGTSLATHNFAWLHIALWLPLQAVFGEGAAYSLLMLGNFVLNGFAVYLLVLTLTNKRSVSILSGFIAAFWPNILSHHDHPNLIVTAWVSLTLLAIYQTFKTGKWRFALWAGLFLALMGITRWQSLLFGGIAITLFFFFLVGQRRFSLKTKQVIATALLINGIALLLMLPLLLEQFIGASNAGTAIESVAASGGQSDLLAYFLPNRFHPLWGEAAFRAFYGSLQTNKVFVAFAGYTTLLLVGLSLIYARHKARFWIGLAIIYVLLALGAELLVNGHPLIPLPYRLIEPTFLGALIRTPDRFNVFLSIPVAVLAGLGAEAILDQRGQNGRSASVWRQLLVISCTLLILIEYAVRYPTLPLDNVPNWYNILALEEGDFAILEWPMSDKSYDEDYMQYQSVHHKAIVGGSIARPLADSFRFVDNLPALKNRIASKTPPPNAANVGHHLTTLADADVKYLVFHKQFMNGAELAAWRDWLGVQSVYEDNEVLVYPTALEVGKDTPFVPITPNGLGLIEAVVDKTAVSQGSPLTIDIRWGATRPQHDMFQVCFRLVGDANQTWHSDCSQLSAVWLTELWGRNEIVDSSYSFTPSPYLNSGTYELLADVVGTHNIYTVPIGQLDLTAQPRRLATLPSSQLQAIWDNKIGLLDYKLVTVQPNQLEVAFTWQAQQRMSTSYKLFVHLIDQQTGEIVGQVDTVPRNWAYPTSWWEQHELVSDTVLLSIPERLDETKQYTLWIGFYNPDSGERLLATANKAPQPTQTDRLRLADVQLAP